MVSQILRERMVVGAIAEPRTKGNGIARGGNILEGEFSALMIADVSTGTAEDLEQKGALGFLPPELSTTMSFLHSANRSS